jgi:hypothetical protein
MSHLNDLMRLISEGSERCSLCRRPFKHRNVLYGGVASSGAVAVVGECCVHRMKEVCGIAIANYGAKAPLDA